MTPVRRAEQSFAGAFGRPEVAIGRVEALVNDRRSGAGELAARALGFLAVARPASGVSVEVYASALWGYASALAKTRPAMAPVENAVCAAVDAVRAERRNWRLPRDVFESFRRCAAAQCRRLSDARRDAASQYARRPLKRPIVISHSSAVLAALEAAPPRRVTVCESRPGLEGRKTARHLQSLGRRVRVVTESQLLDAVRDCDGALLGCDAVHPDGTVRNKMGSALLALAARRAERPVIALADSFKLSRRAFRENEWGRRRDVWRGAPSSIDVDSEIFETVPADLVTRIVMECGPVGPQTLGPLWAECQRRCRALRRGAPGRGLTLAAGRVALRHKRSENCGRRPK